MLGDRQWKWENDGGWDKTVGNILDDRTRLKNLFYQTHHLHGVLDRDCIVGLAQDELPVASALLPPSELMIMPGGQVRRRNQTIPEAADDETEM